MFSLNRLDFPREVRWYVSSREHLINRRRGSRSWHGSRTRKSGRSRVHGRSFTWRHRLVLHVSLACVCVYKPVGRGGTPMGGLTRERELMVWVPAIQETAAAAARAVIERQQRRCRMTKRKSHQVKYRRTWGYEQETPEEEGMVIRGWTTGFIAIPSKDSSVGNFYFLPFPFRVHLRIERERRKGSFFFSPASFQGSKSDEWKCINRSDNSMEANCSLWSTGKWGSLRKIAFIGSDWYNSRLLRKSPPVVYPSDGSSHRQQARWIFLSWLQIHLDNVRSSPLHCPFRTKSFLENYPPSISRYFLFFRRSRFQRRRKVFDGKRGNWEKGKAGETKGSFLDPSAVILSGTKKLSGRFEASDVTRTVKEIEKRRRCCGW